MHNTLTQTPTLRKPISRAALRRPALVNMLQLPKKEDITSVRAAQQALQSCHYISTQLLNRATSGNATSSSRLIMQQHVIQLITSLFVEVLPKPLPGAPHYAGPDGADPLPGEGKQVNRFI